MSYPPRVYCFVDNNRFLQKWFMANNDKHSKRFVKNDDLFDEFKNWYELSRLKQTGQVFDTNEYVVFEIDTSKIKDIKFYCDNLFFTNGKF